MCWDSWAVSNRSENVGRTEQGAELQVLFLGLLEPTQVEDFEGKGEKDRNAFYISAHLHVL